MKWSKYNYFFKSEKHGYLLYNALTNVFLRMTESDAAVMSQLQQNAEILTDLQEQEMLVNSKILVEDDEDELSRLKVENLLSRFALNELMLTIMPTLDCNFRCAYCYEKTQSHTEMSEDIQQKVVEFIRGFGSINQIDITWYGGEPLLAMNVIESLTAKIKDLKIPIQASMVTNGYLLDENMVRKLIELSITSVQITIDGIGEIHNIRRPHVSENDSFSCIIANLDRLFSVTDEISVAVRINLDHQNKDNFPQLVSFLVDRYRDKKLVLSPAFVENIKGCCMEDVCVSTAQAKAAFWNEMFHKFGIYNSQVFPHLELGSCMVRKLNSFVISYDGNLYKCWNDVGRSDKAIGNVMKKGMNTTLLSRYLKSADKWDDPTCLSCLLFPICDGGCPYMRLENLYEGAHNDCCIAAKDSMAQFLENHYEMKQIINSGNAK